jgi:MoxR-like ATPase
VAPHVIAHAVALVRGTRPVHDGDDGARSQASASPTDVVKNFVSFGAGPRASQALILAAKARAVLDGRYAAEIDDVRALALPIMRHRLVMSFRAEAEGVRASTVIEELLRTQRA